MFKSCNENVHFIEQKSSICKAKIRTNGNIGKLMPVFLFACPPRGDARKPFFARAYTQKNTPKNYTCPAQTDLITWYLVRLIVYSLYFQPSTSDGLTRCECPCFPQDDFTFSKIIFAFCKIVFTFRKGVFTFSKIVFTICAEKVC